MQDEIQKECLFLIFKLIQIVQKEIKWSTMG